MAVKNLGKIIFIRSNTEHNEIKEDFQGCVLDQAQSVWIFPSAELVCNAVPQKNIAQIKQLPTLKDKLMRPSDNKATEQSLLSIGSADRQMCSLHKNRFWVAKPAKEILIFKTGKG